MPWTLDQAKVYLEISPGDTSKDVLIQGVMDTTLLEVETKLQRGLFLARTTARFYDVDYRKILLPRYPITQVWGINGSPTPSGLIVHYHTGWLEWPDCLNTDYIEVDYEGGYASLPLDLERALWSAFLTLWGNTDETTGAPGVGDGGGVVTPGSGDVKDVTVFDAFKISYDVGSSTSSAEALDSLAQDQVDWGWLSPWAGTLAFYRSEMGTGLGMA